MKVLILSCSTGGGHNSCARYIKEELDNNNIESVFMDFYDIVNKKAKKVAENIYLKTLNGEGKYFRMFYKLGEMYSNTKIKSPVYLVNKFHKKKLYEYIKDNNFDLVITTHLFPSLTLTAINKNKEKVKFITIATDYEPCPFLEESKPNYLIMQKDLEERFIKKGFDKDILVNTGIPISSRFICDAKNIRDKFNIKEEKLILIMLGSMGFGNINSIIDDISKINNIKIIIVCGSNKKLYNELSKINNDKLIILGFVNNINDLIYSADIVMSKPGGLSSTEITSLRKPLLHIFPIPGIETYNTNFFLNHKMSLKCENKEEIISNLNKHINDNDLQKEMIKNQEKYINKYSGADLVKLIKEKMSNH